MNSGLSTIPVFLKGAISDGWQRNLTGVSPLRRSAGAVPIVCDALNARTVAIQEYHYIFCASWPTSCYACFPASVLVALLFLVGESVMAHPPRGSAQKGRIRFALYCAAVILRRFLFQGATTRPELAATERGTLLFSLDLESQDSPHEL